jgi:hypothetical protein
MRAISHRKAQASLKSQTRGISEHACLKKSETRNWKEVMFMFARWGTPRRVKIDDRCSDSGIEP